MVRHQITPAGSARVGPLCRDLNLSIFSVFSGVVLLLTFFLRTNACVAISIGLARREIELVDAAGTSFGGRAIFARR